MRALVALLLVSLSVPVLPAQREPRLEIRLPQDAELATSGPAVRAAGMLTNGQLRDLLRSGFPTRLHYRVDLWSTGGLLNDLERSLEWDVIVRYDPLDRRYRVARIVGARVTSLGNYEELAGAEEAVERPFVAPITPPGRKRYYYAGAVQVQTLSLSDLDEVERWLRGEARPAVRGQRNPGTALARGLRTLFVRVLGGDTRSYKTRTETFRPG
ncbi:MAG TPA: hypothetical protein VNA89_12970 [Gemmatimonadaceae bacterium]|nr:hypothetical protein [Gemmatimonadaceae bacterium]